MQIFAVISLIDSEIAASPTDAGDLLMSLSSMDQRKD